MGKPHMNPDNAKKLLDKLLLVASADEIDPILSEYKFSTADWKPYGGRPKNWDIVSNQQSNAVGALTEIITNSIDAVLSRKAHEAGIEDLSSAEAPQSMQEAIKRFYSVIEGKLSSLEPRELTNLAEKSILIGVKRNRSNSKFPNITVIDYGEGQHPKDFEKTLLSLSETNKEGIAFVQGEI